MLLRRLLTLALGRSGAGLISAAMFAAPAAAQSVGFTNIVSTGVTAPNGSAFTALGNFPAMDGSTIAFQGTSGGVQGIYSGTGGALATLVAPSSPIPNGTGNFTAINLSFRYDSGSVIFVGSGTGPTQSGIYTSNGTTITRIADLTTAIPGGTGDFTSFSPSPSLSNGVATFSGAGASSQSGVYSTSTGSLAAVADLNTAAPSGGNFTAIGSNSTVSGTTTVFRASSSLGSYAGIYSRTGSGPITTVADVTTPIPGGSGNFTGTFSEPTISGSNVAFIGSTATSKGIYLYTNGQLVTLLDNTTGTFDGKTLAATPFFLGPDAISGNQVAFDVSFTSPTSSGIYVATFSPAPEPSLLLLAAAGIACRRRLAIKQLKHL